jgi:hypothetical protein
LLTVVVFISVPVQAKTTVGWVENAVIYPGNILVKAKVDTGARHSSLHCECKTIVKKDGERYIRFSIKNFKGKRVELERKVYRVATIKRHHERRQQRDVIKLAICLGNTLKQVEVNVVDRSGFNYQLLIGRSFLKNDFVVDPALKFVHAPQCQPPSQ